MSIDQNKAVIIRFIDEVLNKRNYSVMDEFVAEDFIEHVPFPGQGPGRKGLKDALTLFATGFPESHWKLEEQIAEGDTVVSRVTFTGTHNGPFLGIPATGRKVNVWGVVIDVVRNGWFCESRIILDTTGLMQQLGVVPGA